MAAGRRPLAISLYLNAVSLSAAHGLTGRKIPVPRALALVVAASAVLASTAACGGRSGSGGTAMTAAQLSSPLAVPAGSFTDTANEAYDLANQSKGVLTLVFFGYTNCPDECPTTMADLGNALRSLPAAVSENVQVVFITSDPARDTPAVMSRWLANFDHGLPRPFIGLRNSVAAVDAYAAQVGVPLEPPKTRKDGSIDVTHGTQVIAFSPTTHTADYVWLSGTTAQQYAADIAKLESGAVT